MKAKNTDVMYSFMMQFVYLTNIYYENLQFCHSLIMATVCDFMNQMGRVTNAICSLIIKFCNFFPLELV